MRMLRTLLLSLLALPSCYSSQPEDPLDLAPDGSRGPLAVLATSDFMSGALAHVDLRSRAVEKRLDTIDPQAVVRVYGGKVYVLDQNHGVLRVYSPHEQWRTPLEIATGNALLPQAQANPHDIYVDTAAQRAYVTLYGAFGSTAVTGERALGVLDLRQPHKGIVAFVPLQVATADRDGNPEADRFLLCGGRLYVTLQDLDRNNMAKPAGPARLAILTLAQPTAAGYIQLTGYNPTALVAPGGRCNEALVAHGDDQLSATPRGKGGIEAVDLPGQRSLGLLLTDQQLGGVVSAMDAADPTRVFVDLLSKRGMEYHHEVFVLDVVARQKGARILGSANYVPALRVIGDELLVLVAGTPAGGQLRTGVYLGRADGQPLPLQPIDVGLPPISVDVLLP